jgi:D-sedoheptulose 7-phosphate isomerase
MKTIIKNEFDEHIKTANLLHGLTNEVASAAQLCSNCLNNGKKILIFGNGGSAADAQHIAAELVGRYQTDRRALPVIALTTDSSAITSISNDYGYEYVFSRQVEALAQKGDVVVGISTSGKSNNVINALNIASKLKCKTIGLSGKDGGLMHKACDINLIAPSSNTPRIQEMHIVIGHIICLLIEKKIQD